MNYLTCTIFGFLFIFLMTSLGALFVVFFRRAISDRVNSIFLGFASGVMVASSVWSLIIPSIDAADYMGKFSFVPAIVGILIGMAFLILLAKILPHDDEAREDRERSRRLFVAVTVHNIPEGLAVGFAFGTAFSGGDAALYVSAMGLALGIGLQNLPEGAAVALPIRAVTGSRTKGLCYGVMSGVVEPIFAIVGYFMASYLISLQPWLLAFAAGAMLFVVADDLIPDASRREYHLYGSISFIVGFIIMMMLDVALG